MRKSIIINAIERKQLFIVNNIDDGQIFQLVGLIEKTLHQSNLNHLTDEELITLAKEQLGIDLEPTRLIAEININKQKRDS